MSFLQDSLISGLSAEGSAPRIILVIMTGPHIACKALRTPSRTYWGSQLVPRARIQSALTGSSPVFAGNTPLLPQYHIPMKVVMISAPSSDSANLATISCWILLPSFVSIQSLTPHRPLDWSPRVQHTSNGTALAPRAGSENIDGRD